MEYIYDNIKNELNDDTEETVDSLVENYENLSENNVNTYFKMPIYYSNKIELNDTLVKDLELKDTSENKSIYKKLFQSDSKYLKYEDQIIDQWSNYYTDDKKFLKDQQTFIKNFKNNNYPHETNNELTKEMYESWLNIKNLKYFNEKYQFLSWEILYPLNTNSFFLTFLSYYNLSSPVFSILFPLLMLIIPLFVLKLRGIDISFGEYWNIIKVILANNSVIQLFTNFNQSTIQEKFYLIVSCIFYLIQIYQNIQYCIMFHRNLSDIMSFYENTKKYISFTKKRMECILKNNLNTFNSFNFELNEKYKKLCSIEKNLLDIKKPNSFVFQIGQIGYIMKNYYELYNDDKFHNSFMYSVGFNTYYNHLIDISNLIENNKMNYCDFISKKKQSNIKNNYYLPLIDENPIKNNLSMKKNIIITGPNASGKTTILKGFLINQILSQQIGCGCYESANIKCYDYIYSYLNIPDTSGRDSLFQAEARRCKEILDNINKNPKKHHLCIFDELYSGTNPTDAVETAFDFIKFICKFKSNVRFLITTHYFDLCNKCVKNKINVIQKCMKTIDENNSVKYTYLLEDGINNTRAGKDILKKMNYPDEITN